MTARRWTREKQARALQFVEHLADATPAECEVSELISKAREIRYASWARQMTPEQARETSMIRWRRQRELSTK